VQLPVSIIKAGGCEEEGFVRYKIINADMMWCLQSALTFHRSDSVRRPARRGEGEGDPSRPEKQVHACIGEPLMGAPRGRYRPALKWNKAHPLAKSRAA